MYCTPNNNSIGQYYSFSQYDWTYFKGEQGYEAILGVYQSPGTTYSPAQKRAMQPNYAAYATGMNGYDSGISAAWGYVATGAEIGLGIAVGVLTGGLGTVALEGLGFGTGATAIGAGLIGGISGGYGTGVGQAYQQGGTFGQALTSSQALIGAASGAIGGGIGGGVFAGLGGLGVTGALQAGLTGVVGGAAGGFIGGGLSTGTWEGAGEGALIGGALGGITGVGLYGASSALGALFAEQTVTGYRAVSQAEWDQIQRTGEFSSPPNASTPTGNEGKWFYGDQTSAQQFGNSISQLKN